MYTFTDIQANTGPDEVSSASYPAMSIYILCYMWYMLNKLYIIHNGFVLGRRLTKS